MKHIPLSLGLCIGLGFQALLAATATPELGTVRSGPEGDMVVWYRQPAEKWLDASPLGNGLMGAMVFGRVQKERIALNDSSFWSGRPHDYNDTNASAFFPQIRDLVFAGRFQEAERMADEHFWGIPKAQQAYQPIGDLLLSFDGLDAVADYRRELDMETGVARVRFRAQDAVFTREIFVSYPDRVLVVRLAADRPGRITVGATLKSPFMENVVAAPGKLVMDGCWKGPNPVTNALIASVEGKGERFESALVARVDGGQSDATADTLRITGANTITFVLATATSFVNYQDIAGDPAARCEASLGACASKDYASLLARHETDFQGLMGRVHLRLGDPATNAKPTEVRLQAVRDGSPDPNLASLVFQCGRYLLAASSRAGGQAANLQGIWNESTVPPWGSKYTININTEMNYWPVEVCNLAECAQPLFDMITDVSITGSATAKIYYGCGGWMVHHNIDLWRGTAPVDAAKYGMWPVGGAWLCQSIWEHYAFSGDRQFLRASYPILKGAAQFLLELMTEEPEHHWLVTPFSMSPEHGYIDAQGKLAFLSPSPTMDVALIRELFPHCIEASKLLDLDSDFRARLEAALTRIPPYQIGKSGFVQEWIEDWQPGNQGHNVSPNFPFFPGSSLTLRQNPEFAAAYGRWLEAHPARGGFPLVWDIAMWARLEDGAKVEAGIEAYLTRAPALNLHNSGSNQSDASFGYTAAVAEVLLQSHAGEISLLPALPPSWRDGSVTGLRARGNCEVAMNWSDGKLTSAELHSVPGGRFKARYREKTAAVEIAPGQTVRLDTNLAVASAHSRDYQVDGKISRPVLENYLSRSICMEGMLHGRGDLTDNIRMLKAAGAKYVARALCLWGAERDFTNNLQRAREAIPQVLAADPDLVLEACVFETVSPKVNDVFIPEWVFTALGQPVEHRNFRYEDMIYPVGQRRAMGRNAQVPDESRMETQLWFYYQAASYIDAGCEGIHFGQVEIMNKNDRNNEHWARLLGLVRQYAGIHARRHMVLCNGHVPTGGLMHDGNPLLDFNAFPLRVMEVPDKPQEAILKLGFSDGLYNRSKGGTTFSGWTCEHLPYIAELDNYGVSRHPGQPNAKGEFNWIWGYDEITWFAHQSKEYRARWLAYAWNWVRKTDPNGYLEMPGGRTATSPDTRWYFANNRSSAVPTGLGDEEAIGAIWAASDAAAR